MVFSYVLIGTENTYEHEVARKLLRLDEVVDVEPLLVEETALADSFFEDYDLIIKIKAPTQNQIKSIINDKIHTMLGVNKIKIVSTPKGK
jgi:DNA-binding Lrp family transcriptional regulator